MRIAIDYTSALAQGAGIGRYTRELAAALARVDTADHFRLYSSELPREGRDFPHAPNMRPRVAALGARGIGNRAMTLLWHRLRLPLPIEAFTGRVDVFHAPDFSLAPTAWARRIVTIHDLSYAIHPEYALPAVAAYLRRVVPRAVRGAERVIAVSRRTADDLTARLAVPPDKITVIPLGVGPEFRPPRDEARLAALAEINARYGLAHPLVLAVGTVEPRKNYARLIAAFARAAAVPDGPRMLAVAGRDGWHSEGVYAAAEQRGARDRVRFLGYVPEVDLPALYAAADVVAMPSLYEGFGLPVLEAMACGVPVLCSDGGALPEVAGDAGLVVPAEDTDCLAATLLRLLGDPALRGQLIARGLRRAQQFTWDAAARTHVAVYHAVGSRPRGARPRSARGPR